MPSRSSTSVLSALAAPIARAVWHADALGSVQTAGLCTGFARLNSELPGQGWPCSVLTELLWAQQGSGEFRLLAPVLAGLARAGRTIVLLSPPLALCAPALAQLDIDPGRLLLVRTDQPADRLWAAEQVLRSAHVGALLCWLPQAKPEQLRRLQLAAGGVDGLSFVFRPASARTEPSPAPLRLLCRAGPRGQVRVDVFKRRGSTAGAPVILQTCLPACVTAGASSSAAAVPSFSEIAHAVDRPLPAATAA